MNYSENLDIGKLGPQQLRYPANIQPKPRQILKNKIKGEPQYVVSAIFLVEISEGRIGTANPQFFASARRIY
jgi:hypothetical protein